MREIVIPTFYFMTVPISQSLQELAEAGVRLAELHGDEPDIHFDLTDAESVAALASAARGLPIEIYSVHCAFSKPSYEAWDISQPDDGKRSVAVGNMIAAIKACAALGARHTIIHPGAHLRDEGSISRSRESLSRLAEVAASTGTQIAVENLPPDQLGGRLPEVKMLVEGLAPGVIGYCLDTGHAMLGETRVEEYVRAMGDGLLAIHWHGNNSSEDGHLFPDVTESAWDEFFTSLDEIGYDLPVTVEAVPPPTTPLHVALSAVRSALQYRPRRLCK